MRGRSVEGPLGDGLGVMIETIRNYRNLGIDKLVIVIRSDPFQDEMMENG
jgi:hypothetical protein